MRCVSKPVNIDQASARLDGALKLAIVFDSTAGRWKSRFKKFFLRPVVYPTHLIARKLRQDFPARTFWGRKLILPSWDGNTASICYSGLLSVGDADLTRYLLRSHT